MAGRQSERDRERGTHGKPDFVDCADIYIIIGNCQATHSLMSGTKASEVLLCLRAAALVLCFCSQIQMTIMVCRSYFTSFSW
jgi:hypothetical protein